LIKEQGGHAIFFVFKILSLSLGMSKILRNIARNPMISKDRGIVQKTLPPDAWVLKHTANLPKER
jgi:hypothetical protein